MAYCAGLAYDDFYHRLAREMVVCGVGITGEANREEVFCWVGVLPICITPTIRVEGILICRWKYGLMRREKGKD